MAQRVVIAVDVLGGDIGPSVVLPGIEKALQADSELEVIACGPAEVVEPFAEKHDHAFVWWLAHGFYWSHDGKNRHARRYAH